MRTCVMAIPEEADVLQLLRDSVEQCLISSSVAGSASEAAERVYKKYRQSTSRVNALLDDVFVLERKIEVRFFLLCDNGQFLA